MDLGYKLERGIYLVSPSKIENIKEFVSDLKFIFKRFKIICFQLRLKNITEFELIECINILKPICIKYNVNFILNDLPQIAAKYACDGLHFGKEDGSLQEIMPKFQGIIGVSCYNEVERALQFAGSGVSYVSFGAFFKTKTKENTVECSISVLEKFVSLKPNFPVCVIGGISSLNAKPLVEAGASLVALSSAIWDLKKNNDKALELEKLSLIFN